MPAADDEGHATFARESIKLLLGRPARGADEVEVVADIAKLLGRDVAVKMLMKDTAFVDTWAENLVDLLQVQREAGGGLPAQDQTCWGAPTRANPDPAIATWVRDHGPNDGGAPPAWNMSDLLRSAIAIDDLSPVYRAFLFTLSMRRQGSNNTSEVTARFMRTYLNRDLTCLRCHNPTFSASNKTDAGGNIVWQRTWTIPGHPEKALFGNYFDAATALNGLRKVMRGDVRKPAPGPVGIRPWGMAASCVKDSIDGDPPNSSPATHDGFQTLAGTNPGADFGSISGAAGPASLFELEAAFRTGVDDLKDGYARFTASSPILPPDQQLYCDAVAVFASNCVGCHSSPGPSGGLDLGSSDPSSQLINVNTNAVPKPPNLAKRVVPSDLVHSELWRRIDGNIMPPGGLPAAPPGTERPALQNWISGGAPHTADTSTCNTSPIPDVDPNEALAFLTAANLVDGIWMAAMGYRLTIDNGFPRNSQQRDMLWNLTEYEFLPKHWSLKAVLSKIMASNWYARRAPVISQDDSAYGLPPILDPWIVADPTVVANPPAHERYNGQGELVDRFRVNTLLRSIGAGLGWKGPRRFPGGGYPSPFDQDLGQHISPQTPGFRGINFQSLLALESQVGLCNKSGRALAADDWIDKLVDGIVAYNTANPAAPITMGEAWSMLKDRLIQDPSINTAPAERIDRCGRRQDRATGGGGLPQCRPERARRDRSEHLDRRRYARATAHQVARRLRHRGQESAIPPDQRDAAQLFGQQHARAAAAQHLHAGRAVRLSAKLQPMAPDPAGHGTQDRLRRSQRLEIILDHHQASHRRDRNGQPEIHASHLVHLVPPVGNRGFAQPARQRRLHDATAGHDAAAGQDGTARPDRERLDRRNVRGERARSPASATCDTVSWRPVRVLRARGAGHRSVRQEPEGNGVPVAAAAVRSAQPNRPHQLWPAARGLHRERRARAVGRGR